MFIHDSVVPVKVIKCSSLIRLNQPNSLYIDKNLRCNLTAINIGQLNEIFAVIFSTYEPY